MNPFTAKMLAQAEGMAGFETSIHPNGRNFKKPYPAPGNGSIRKKAMKRLAARRLDHSATVGRDSAKAESYKSPGSMSK